MEKHAESGQATVEAAVCIPVLFVLLLLLLQPAFLLYDRIVMMGAAQEACRLLATKTDALGDMQGACEAFVRHRLSAIPQTDCFHVHGGGCTWEIELDGDETAEEVRVRIATQVRPLPLVDAAGALLGFVNDKGNLVVEVEASAATQPAWVESRNPESWVGGWL
ncbi:TadE/TadG family type IV pilus assembly protein [Xiamenia xianingshaonis]|uniref:Pilus assembly protein n=1 Tax=Xiamenia xianingshaonis TaxID=2682776 RepID=A0A9E6MPD3_9ACTN|nr:TadE/TadG family type IV pilus assembly protein [Xiamenia xianingshaonis]NHM14041.1 pilus assembly protein [Xiamenia xianingshaonis]QTU83912.1 pilus assembly protein [Xiamenia xianingshaonis]